MYSNIIFIFRLVKGVMNMYGTMKRSIIIAVMFPTCLQIQIERGTSPSEIRYATGRMDGSVLCAMK